MKSCGVQCSWHLIDTPNPSFYFYFSREKEREIISFLGKIYLHLRINSLRNHEQRVVSLLLLLLLAHLYIVPIFTLSVPPLTPNFDSVICFCGFSDYLFKLLLIGDSSVGKSCLLLRFAVSLTCFD